MSHVVFCASLLIAMGFANRGVLDIVPITDFRKAIKEPRTHFTVR